MFIINLMTSLLAQKT